MGLRTWWIRGNLRRYLAALAALPQGERQQVVDNLFMRAAELRARRDGVLDASWLAWLEDRLKEDMRQHRAARTAGARSRHDPRWLRAAILRTWTLLLIHEARGTLAADTARHAEEEIAAVFRPA